MIVKDLVAKIQAKGHTVDLSGPATPDAVRRIESAIGRRLPESYHSFLLTFGGLSIYDRAVSVVWGGDDIDSGCGTVLGDTSTLKSEGCLPDGLAALLSISGAARYVTRRTSRTD
jgi:hypothetical protein